MTIFTALALLSVGACFGFIAHSLIVERDDGVRQ